MACGLPWWIRPIHLLKSPRASRHPVDVGQRTEGAILHELIRRGYAVLIPWGVNQRYDLLIEVVFESHDDMTSFLTAHCYSEPDIASIEIMTGLVMYKNQFLLKREFE